jgi:DNA replication protein DnaC
MRSSPRPCCPPAKRTGEGRIRSARFPACKTLEEFDFTFQPSVKKTMIEYLVHRALSSLYI